MFLVRSYLLTVATHNTHFLLTAVTLKHRYTISSKLLHYQSQAWTHSAMLYFTFLRKLSFWNFSEVVAYLWNDLLLHIVKPYTSINTIIMYTLLIHMFYHLRKKERQYNTCWLCSHLSAYFSHTLTHKLYLQGFF